MHEIRSEQSLSTRIGGEVWGGPSVGIRMRTPCRKSCWRKRNVLSVARRIRSLTPSSGTYLGRTLQPPVRRMSLSLFLRGEKRSIWNPGEFAGVVRRPNFRVEHLRGRIRTNDREVGYGPCGWGVGNCSAINCSSVYE